MMPLITIGGLRLSKGETLAVIDAIAMTCDAQIADSGTVDDEDLLTVAKLVGLDPNDEMEGEEE